MARAKRKRKAPEIVRDDVTPERAQKNGFTSIGMARRVIPEIVRLHEKGILSDNEFTGLAYYRDQASLAEHSPIRSCIDFSPKGGHGPGAAILSAKLETARMERNMGELSHLVRAVAVDDKSLEQWVADRHACAPWEEERERKLIGIAALELKFAAGYVFVA